MSDLEKSATEENKDADVTEVLDPEELTVTEAEEETGEDPTEEENGSKRKKTIIAVVAALAVILVVAGSAIALNGNSKEEVATPAPEAEVVEETIEAKVFVTVDAKDATKDNTTPVKISIKDVKSGKFVKEAEFPVDEKYELGILPEGNYELYVSRVPVFDDGSTYKLPEKPHEFTVNKTTAVKDIEFTVLLDQMLKAEDMTKEQLEESAKILDHFSKKDEAEAVREAASEAESDPDSVKDIQQSEDTTVTAPVSTAPRNDSTSTSGSNSSGSSSSAGSSSSSSSGNSSSGSSSSSSSTPSHQHSWTAVTEQQWVSDGQKWVSDGQKWVVDQAAWTETVKQGSYIQCSCGATFGSNSEWSAHNKGIMLDGNPSHSYSVVPNYTTVNHPEQGHYETVTIGYKCSCGAWK